MEALFEVWRGASCSKKVVDQDRNWDDVQMLQPTFTYGVRTKRWYYQKA